MLSLVWEADASARGDYGEKEWPEADVGLVNEQEFMKRMKRLTDLAQNRLPPASTAAFTRRGQRTSRELIGF